MHLDPLRFKPTAVTKTFQTAIWKATANKSKSSFLERQRSIWSFKQVLLETVSDMIVDFSLSYRCCRAQAQ